MTGGSLINSGGGPLLISGDNGSVGVFKLSGGTVTAFGNYNGASIIIGLNSGSTGTLNQNGGAITCNNEFHVGDTTGGHSTATYNLSAGSISLGNWVAIGRADSTGVLNISGGSMTKTSSGNNFIISSDQTDSSGTINQTGGAITNTVSDTYIAGYTAGTGVWNMNGGDAVLSLQFSSVTKRPQHQRHDELEHKRDVDGQQHGGGGSAPTSFNFNGGTLIASGDSATFTAA